MSLVGKHGVVDIEVGAPGQLSTWLAGINHILTCTGCQVVLEEESPTECTRADGSLYSFSRRRFCVSPYKHPGIAPLELPLREGPIKSMCTSVCALE